MRLEDVGSVRALEFDLSNRLLTVYHNGPVDAIQAALDPLGLDALHLQSNFQDAAFSRTSFQRKILWSVLAINFAFFVIEVTTGLIAESMALVADSLDMLADAFVYGMSLLAVGATVARKKSVARWSGYFQLALAMGGFIEVVRRFLGFEVLPDFRVMIVVAVFALLANFTCLILLRRSRGDDAHIQASMIFTSNDIIINGGVIAAGVLVSVLGSNLPDLIIGGIVFLIVTRGATRILALAK
jgi:Co/Zn/Cd efflux system component